MSVASTSIRPQSLREAAELDAAGKCDEAERLYRDALGQGPPSRALLNNAGNHYLACGNPTKAEEYFKELLRGFPLHENANLQLARIAAERKQGSKALEYLARLKASDWQVSLVRAEALYWAGQRAASLSILDEAGKSATGDPRMLFLLGLSCGRLELYNRAEAAFNSALVLVPGDFDITFNLGRAAARAQHYDRAQRALDGALNMRPDDVNVLLELGRVSAARQDYVRAVFYLAKARQNAPENTDILLLLSRAAEDAGYYEDAAAAYDEYLGLKPGDITVRRDRARVYGQIESRVEQGLEEIKRYLSKRPNDAQGHYIAAQILWGTQPEKAMHHLTEAVRLDPSSVSIRFSRAWMLQRAGQMAESLPDLEVAHRLAPENARILDLIGLAYLSLDRPGEAEKVLREALSTAPGNPEVIMHLGRALMALGREQEAQAYMDKYRAVRPQALPGLRKRTGMIELASMTSSEQRRREIERFRRESRNHPDRPDYQLHLSSLLLADGQKQEALQEFRRLLTLNADGQVCHEAGSLLLRSGEYRLARDFLERAAAEKPAAILDLAVAVFRLDGTTPALAVVNRLPAGEWTGDVLLLKASILEAAGRREEAATVLNDGLSLVPTKPRIVEQAALLLLRLNRKQDALNLLEQALRANPDESDLLLMRAAVLALSDRRQAAEKALKEIELRWPEWDRAYLAQGLLLESTGKLQEARRTLQTALALGSKDPALGCALSRIAAASSASECACSAGLEPLLFNNCKHP